MKIKNEQGTKMGKKGNISRLREFLQHTHCGKHGALTVFLIAVNRLHEIYDLHGFDAGEALFQDRIQGIRRAVGVRGRIFQAGQCKVIVVAEELSPDQSRKIGQQMMQCLQSPFRWKEQPCFVTANMGIVLVPEGGWNPERWLADAEIALYDSFRKGEYRISLFCGSMRQILTRQVRIETELQQALERQELRCLFQPMIDIRNGCVTGAEALMRWESSVLGSVSPEEFIPLLEKSGLIGPFDFWMLESVCRQIGSWRQQGIPVIPISVNISAVDMEQDCFYERFMDIFQRYGIHPRDIGVEVTERVLMSADSCGAELLNRLRMQGVTIIMDDFGVEYSSLQYLCRLPIDVIKIDRSFIRGMSRHEGCHKIVRSIISLAKDLHIMTVAEGVEIQEEADRLRGYGCDMIQGFFYYRPMAADQLEKILQGHRC